MRHIGLFGLPCIAHDIVGISYQDGFVHIRFYLFFAYSCALWDEFLVLRNKNQQRVKLCRRRASQSSQRVEGYFEIVEGQRERVVSSFAYFGVLALLACGQSPFSSPRLQETRGIQVV